MKTYRILELDVINWAEARSIIPNSTPKAQAIKTLEEAGELLQASSKLHILEYTQYKDTPIYNEIKEQYRDALGDVLVTMIIGAALADVDLVDCLNQAYNEIKDRKGYMDSNGIFIKES
jgi:NTP pyrophosphatase (non-canonical NTP hydrolase)